MNIWHLTDGKTGHIAQVRGLFSALKRQNIAFNVVEVSVEHLTWSDYYHMLLSKQYTRKILQIEQPPDLIIGCGHTTHIPLILLKRAFAQTRTLLLMSPSLPLVFFDLVMLPEHDRRTANKRTFVYDGVINPLQNVGQHKANKHLILIGGPSKRHGWSGDTLGKQLATLTNQHPEVQFTLSTSRRTPESFWKIPALTHNSLTLKSVSDKNATTEWMYNQLHQSQVAWVTEDSMSMIYEALNAGCQVGLLALPRHREDRITAATDELISLGRVLTLSDYLQGKPFATPLVTTEADRAAHWLIAQLHLSSDSSLDPAKQHSEAGT